MYIILVVVILLLLFSFYIFAQENDNLYQKLDKAIENQVKIEQQISNIEDELGKIWNIVARLSNR
jgi:predicted PurR-regulated permease PerM